MGRDADTDPTAQTTYECHTCGQVTAAEAHPGECPDCETTMRNRGTPLE